MQVDELKGLVKELHQNGIEVFLDVVFNHTAEGNEKGPSISFRGLDNRTYYMLTPEGYYYNFSGTGNTLNCNNPVVRNMVLDCLRYWAAEYHIDGFRFDLAAILGRAPSGAPLPNPPLLESLAFDPILAKCKLIAEAWDAGGLYQVGQLPGVWPLGRVERQVPRHHAALPQGRRGHGRRHGPTLDGLAGPLLRSRHRRVDQLHHLPRRLHPGRHGRLQRQAQRGERREQSGRRQRQQLLELRRRRARPTIRRSASSAVSRSRTPSPCSWSARACR